MSKSFHLSPSSRNILLSFARYAIEKEFNRDLEEPSFESSEEFNQKHPMFVTLMRNGILRGCVGALETESPLIEEAGYRAKAAAFIDHRFPPVTMEEISELTIEISVLHNFRSIGYMHSDEILDQLSKEQSGVLLELTNKKATFLPQVWDKLKAPSEFLNHLCLKMGVPENSWRDHKVRVTQYDVLNFSE